MSIPKISLLAPDLNGGAATRAYLLAQALQKISCQVAVYGFVFGDRIYPQPPQNLPIYAVMGSNYPQIIGPARELLQAIDGDLIYAVKPRPTSLGLALIKRLLTKTPVLLDMDDWEMSWHGGDDWAYRPTPKKIARDLLKPQGALRDPNHPLYIQLLEKLISQADALTVDSRFLQHRFGGTYLPNGKDTDRFDPSLYNPDHSRQKYGLDKYRVILFPGTARPHKGLEDVLIALEQLQQPEWRLVIVGGTEINDGYVEYLQQQWGRWLIKLPQFPLEQMPEIVAAAHIFVVPQRQHPTAHAQFPIKLTEGMAMAKPILATRVGDVSEILADTGYLVDAQAPDQIAAQLDWIWQNLPVAQALAQRSRQRCLENYSLPKMAEILKRIIDRLL